MFCFGCVLAYSFEIGFVLSLHFRVALLWVGSAIYVPMYESYMDGCVDSTDGTMFILNIYSIAYNYVRSGGDEVLTTVCHASFSFNVSKQSSSGV